MTKTKALFAEEAVEKRAELLSSIAAGIEEQSVRKFYTMEQIQKMKDSFVEISIAEADIETAKAKAVEEFNKQLKEYKGQKKELLKWLKDRFYDSIENVYKIPDYENGLMEFYDTEGVLISSRRLLPSEKEVKHLAVVAQ